MVITDLFLKHFWLVAIVSTCLSALIFKHRSKKYIKENPDLEQGYSTLFRGYLFWMNIPWIIMGIGCTIGGVPSIQHYLNPKDGNLYVLALYGSGFLLGILGTIWLYFKGGVEMLAKHPGALNMYIMFDRKEIKDPKSIKQLWFLVIISGIFSFVILWISDIPLP